MQKAEKKLEEASLSADFLRVAEPWFLCLRSVGQQTHTHTHTHREQACDLDMFQVLGSLVQGSLRHPALISHWAGP